MTTTIHIQADSTNAIERVTVTVHIKGAPRKAPLRAIDTTGYSLDESIGDVVDLSTRRAS